MTMANNSSLAMGLCASLFLLMQTSDAFAPSQQQQQQRQWRQPQQWTRAGPASSSQLSFFRRGKSEDNKEESNVPSKQVQDAKSDGGAGGGLSEKVPFFSRFGRKDGEPEAKDAVKEPPPVASVAIATEKASKAPAAVVDTPASRAAALRAQAAKTRLEAERLDAELTLRKIERLEKELVSAKAKGSTKGNGSIKDLQRDMELLQRKMAGEDEPPVVAAKKAAPAQAKKQILSSVGAIEQERVSGKIETNALIEPFSDMNFLEIKEMMEQSPSFMVKTLATQVELEFDTVDDINRTELALRVDKLNRLDFSYSNLPKPSFTEQEIDEKRKEMEVLQKKKMVDRRLLDGAKGNDTELAILALEQKYFSGSSEVGEEEFFKIVKGEQWLQPVMEMINKTSVDSAIETLYPPCMRKEGQNPTMAQVQQLLTDVLPKSSFLASSKPEPVEGGYIIRGTNKAKDGDALIEAIDKQLSKTSLGEKMTVLFVNDFTIFANEEEMEMFDFDDPASILYITGPDIVREPRRVLLSIVSALGIATSWYLSLYPFLLNPTLSQRVEQDIALVDANMAPDLSWLTDLSLPLFYTFFGIQLLHDFGHRAVASSYGMETRAPTYVPSLITGITSSVTTFKEPPKNNEAMFDYSVAGPLVGMLASLAAIVVGAQLTVTGDPSSFPSLPLEILRQSTLGGGIIDSILGGGVLSVPEAALGTQAVAAMTIPLHPVVVAGYISLVVNALSVLPIGTTDGGRIGVALFGRGAKLLVGNVFLFGLLFVGLGGSDLFLFYFAFCIACQSGNEIAARNEVDKISFSRVGVATFAYLLALLSLIPFQ